MAALFPRCLDSVVVNALLDRVIEPERLKLLLARVLERSDEANARRKADLDRIRRERQADETGLRRLWRLVENRHESAGDPLFAALMAERRAAIGQLEASERTLVGQLAASKRRIDEAMVERFGAMMRDPITTGAPVLRKGYVQLFVSNVTVSNIDITVSGTHAALEAALVHGDRAGTCTVPSFDRRWCRLQDSNL